MLLVVAGIAMLDRALERALKAPVDAYLRNRTLNLLRAEGPTGLTILLPHLDLNLLRRRLELRDVRIRYDRRDSTRYARFEATAPSVLLTGLDLSDLIWHRDFRLSGIHIESPVLQNLDEGAADTLAASDRSDDTLSVVFPAPDTLLYQVVANWLPDNVRGGRIERLMVEHATFVQRRRRGTEQTMDSTADLTLGIEGLQLDSTRHRVFEHGSLTFATLLHVTLPAGDSVWVERGLLTVAREDTAYSVEMVRTAPGGRGHAIRAVGVTRSQARNSLTIDSLGLAPAADDEAFFAEARRRTTRVRVLATGISVQGLRQGGILQRRATPSLVRIASLDLDVLADQRRPPDPPLRRMPWPARFAALNWTVGADSVVLEHGRIRYGELRAGQPRAAEILFEDLEARLTNVSNDSARAGPRTPMLISARTRLYGAGALSATIAVPVQRGPLTAQVRGTVGAMPLAPLNRFLTPAEGIEISGGAVRSGTFQFDIAAGRANGSFTADYRDLGLTVVNPVTRKQNLGAKLKTLMAGLLTRSSSRLDRRGAVVPAPIRYTLEPDDTFWGVLWQALRSGIVKAVKN